MSTDTGSNLHNRVVGVRAQTMQRTSEHELLCSAPLTHGALTVRRVHVHRRMVKGVRAAMSTATQSYAAVEVGYLRSSRLRQKVHE